MSVQPYSHLIRCKQWADRGLHEAVAANIDQLDAMEASIVMRILDHFHVVDRIFQHNLQGLPHGLKAPRSEVMPDLASLAKDTMEVDAGILFQKKGIAPSRDAITDYLEAAA